MQSENQQNVRVFFGNLHPNTKPYHIHSMVKTFGTHVVGRTYVPKVRSKSPNLEPKTMFLDMSTPEEAQAVIDGLHNTKDPYFERTLIVTHALEAKSRRSLEDSTSEMEEVHMME